jgi:hypothetical protein
MNWIKLIRASAIFVTSASVGAVVSNAVKATTPSNLKTLNQVMVGIGGFIISSMVADAACVYIEKQIDEAIKLVNKEEIKNDN